MGTSRVRSRGFAAHSSRALLAALILACGCATAPENIRDEYEPVTGILVPPVFVDESNRLFLFVRTQDRVVSAVLYNRRESHIVRRVAMELKGASEARPVVLYGRRIEGHFQEFIEGIDYDVVAIGFFSEAAERYLYIQVNYRKGVKESVWEVELKTLLPALLNGVKKFM